MKIRNGFVSNSSSSSFVVAFPHKPQDEDDVKKMLFGKQEWHYTMYCGEGDKDGDVSTQKIAERVFSKIEKEATQSEVFESIRSGYFDSWMDIDIFPGFADCWQDPEYKSLSFQKEEDQQKLRDIHKKYDDINDKRANNIVKAFMDSNKKAYIVVMIFSDNDGEAIEEHSGIFGRIEHIRTSYH
jgi:hypothetical protein